MYTLIENNMIYPEDAWLKQIQQKVIINFTVDPNGITTNVKSVNPTASGLKKKAYA